MSNEPPMVSCLCPTYRRPKLLENSIACFLAQDYPADRRELIILDDTGELQNQTGEGLQVISIPRRFRSLPEKFNALAGLARGEILVVWEDDDIYLSHHISSHVTAMVGHLWSKPSKILSLYTGEVQEEDATGRFHASMAFNCQAFEHVCGWPLTMRGDFDQLLLARFTGIGPPADPCSVTEPSYVFRWGSTAAYHGQALMRGPEDEGWYQTVPQNNQCDNHVFVSPELDEETQLVARSSPSLTWGFLTRSRSRMVPRGRTAMCCSRVRALPFADHKDDMIQNGTRTAA